MPCNENRGEVSVEADLPLKEMKSQQETDQISLAVESYLGNDEEHASKNGSIFNRKPPRSILDPQGKKASNAFYHRIGFSEYPTPHLHANIIAVWWVPCLFKYLAQRKPPTNNFNRNLLKGKSLIAGKMYISWLMLVTVAYTYNSWVLPLRCCFPYQTELNINAWMIADYIMDVIYFLDLVLVKSRVMYLKEGFWVQDYKLTSEMYCNKCQCKMDIMSLLPLDLFCFYYGWDFLPFFRLNRLLKIQTFWEFYIRCDRVVSSAYVVRVARTLTYMLYLIHLNACAYFVFSKWEGLGTNNWVFNGKGNAYIRCFYFATKTATSIGKNPKPENEVEYVFMTCSWLMGVFVFALLIGQIRDIIATATRNQTEYRKLVDETMEYMRRLSLPEQLQERVKLWFKYTWEQQHTFNEGIILDTLPHKLKTDVAINVHIQSLSKVQIFHDCDPALLRELVLKLQPVLFLPGDCICRKGEVGKEMYIVKSGVVQVLGEDENEVLADLTEGSVFGEISLLSLGSGNRRTASVRSGGFSNLFILSKADLNEALVHYPDAQEMLKNKAKMLMQENAEREKLREHEQQQERSGYVTEDSEDSDSGDINEAENLENPPVTMASTWLRGVTSLAAATTHQDEVIAKNMHLPSQCEEAQETPDQDS